MKSKKKKKKNSLLRSKLNEKYVKYIYIWNYEEKWNLRGTNCVYTVSDFSDK